MESKNEDICNAEIEKNGDNKILPFVIPITNCYPATSEATGILFTDNNIYEWMFNSFIQIFEVEGNHAIDYYDFAIDNNPFLSYNEIDYSFIYHNWDSIIDFVISAIDDNYYVRLFVNMRKIAAYLNSDDNQHDMIIFGYNKKEALFYIADHFQKGYFEKKTCTFEELINALDTYKVELFNENYAFLNSAQLIKRETDLMRLRFSMYTPEEMDYILSLNLSRITDSLSDYLNGVPTTNWYTRGRVMNECLKASHHWGIQCYDILKLYVNELKEEHITNDFALQSFYVFYNHKRVMLERIKIIGQKYDLYNIDMHLKNFNELCILSNKAMLKYIKSTMKANNENSCNSLLKSIDELYELDKNYISLLLEDLLKLM